MTAFSCGSKISTVHCFFSFVTKHACDRWTERQTDGQNYDPQNHASITAVRSNKLAAQSRDELLNNNSDLFARAVAQAGIWFELRLVVECADQLRCHGAEAVCYQHIIFTMSLKYGSCLVRLHYLGTHMQRTNISTLESCHWNTSEQVSECVGFNISLDTQQETRHWNTTVTCTRTRTVFFKFWVLNAKSVEATISKVSVTAVQYYTVNQRKTHQNVFWYTVYKTWPTVIKFGRCCSE